MTLKITIPWLKPATMFLLTTATLAAGLLAQLPQLGLSAEILEQRTIASSCLALATGAGLVCTLTKDLNDDTKAAVNAILKFATGQYSVATAQEFYKTLKQQADLTLANRG